MVDPENNILTADKAFVSISFFNLIRMPLNSLPMLVIQMIQASVSLKRVNDYLNSKEINTKAITRERSDTNAIEMKNASFTWDTEAPPAIENVSFDIPKGSLVAIVGQVNRTVISKCIYYIFDIKIKTSSKDIIRALIITLLGLFWKIFIVGFLNRRFAKARNS